eukprot:maker-scaffold_9-snap-gene-8.53-mRNA-1 protein AED:0.00 eAED:0.00 QI:108/1/1/1/1/1/2/260/261
MLHEEKEDGTIKILKDFFMAFVAEFPYDISKNVSKSERDNRRLLSSDLVYGEITFDTLLEALDEGLKHFKNSKNIQFADLGSGSGTSCFQILFLSLIYPNIKAILGIELLKDLYKISIHLKSQLNLLVKKQNILESFTKTDIGYDKVISKYKNFDEYKFVISQLEEKKENITFANESFFDNNIWINYNFIYVNCTCFSVETWNKLSALFESCAEGTLILSVTNEIKSTDYQIVWTKLLKMSWGNATLFLQKKKKIYKVGKN